MSLHEMLQHQLELGGVLEVAAGASLGDVVEDHPLDPGHAVGRMDEIVAELQRDQLRQVFVLGNGRYFVFLQFAQCQAFFNKSWVWSLVAPRAIGKGCAATTAAEIHRCIE
ncbi:MAG TPA: hypothetical protein VNN09_00510 [Candidatus Competibacteraceae bacterium]|nr:hypothetical protein [Candidatus Competibacteraceae bacterium]